MSCCLIQPQCCLGHPATTDPDQIAAQQGIWSPTADGRRLAAPASTFFGPTNSSSPSFLIIFPDEAKYFLFGDKDSCRTALEWREWTRKWEVWLKYVHHVVLDSRGWRGEGGKERRGEHETTSQKSTRRAHLASETFFRALLDSLSRRTNPPLVQALRCQPRVH